MKPTVAVIDARLGFVALMGQFMIYPMSRGHELKLQRLVLSGMDNGSSSSPNSPGRGF